MDVVVVLLLLGAIWSVVLIPPWVQARREARPTESIRSFRHQLWSLGRTTPGTVGPVRPGSGHVRTLGRTAVLDREPWPGGDGVDDLYGDAYSEDAYDAYGDEPYGDGYDDPAGYGDATYADATYADLLDADGRAAQARRTPSPYGDGWSAEDEVAAGGDRWAQRRQAPAPERPSPARARRVAEGYRRRRQVLVTLLLATTVTAVPALVVGGTPWLVACGISAALVLIYLALLVRRGSRTAERQEKVHYLAPIVAPRPAVVVLRSGTGR